MSLIQISEHNNQRTSMQISLVIPVYNREQYLPALFASIEKIKDIPLEIIFVDNGSDDNSFALCNSFCEQTSGKTIAIRVISERKRGASAARNAGIKISNGDYVYFFDSDDVLSTVFFNDCMKHDGKDLIVCKTCIEADGKLKQRKTIFPLTLEGHILSSTLSTQSFMIKRSFMNEIGGWDEELPRWNDWELGIRIMLKQPEIAHLNKSYHRIRQHNDSITGSDFSHSFEALLKALHKAHQDILQAQIDSDQMRKALNALSAKAKLLSAWLYRENQVEMSRQTYNFSQEILTSRRFRLLSPPLHLLSKRGVKGIWMLYKMIL